MTQTDGVLMPQSDATDINVVAAATGHTRVSKTWVLGRLLRDMDAQVDHEMKNEQNHRKANMPESQVRQRPLPPSQRPEWEPLRVTVYRFRDDTTIPHGVPAMDLVWISGFITAIVQLGISIVAWAINGNWLVFLTTSSGTVLAFLNASLPQWRAEKWACPKNSCQTVTMTQGNGTRHAVVILGNSVQGLDLEILARGTRAGKTSNFTRVASSALALAWILFLVIVNKLVDDTWCQFIFLSSYWHPFIMVAYNLTDIKPGSLHQTFSE